MSKLNLHLGMPYMDMNSLGDVWEACIAEDGRVYLSSDDTKGFNDQPGSNLQFHALLGEDLSSLRGETINLMTEYGKMTAKGPDGCMWKASGNTCVDGRVYMFLSRHGLNFSARQTAENSSIIMSDDKGKSWCRTAGENYDRPMFLGGRFGCP